MNFYNPMIFSLGIISGQKAITVFSRAVTSEDKELNLEGFIAILQYSESLIWL